MKEKLTPSRLAWAGLLGGVALYDCLAPRGQTLSEALDPLMEHERWRYVVGGAVATTALHLTNVLPQKLDPFHYALSWKDREA